ncbi:MAG: dienelactone hydrolase family protein [Kiritimatiellia bacterium]
MRTVLILLFLGLGCHALHAQFNMGELYRPEVITNSFGETLPVRVWRDFEPTERPVPMVILLHGSGECGKDNAIQLPMFQSFHNTYLTQQVPALLMIPQCTTRNAWVRQLALPPNDKTYRLPRYPAPSLRTLKEAIEAEIDKGTVDSKRVYLIGVSLGAFGTWDAIQRWPHFFAAAVPICGSGSLQESAIKNAASTSLWVFHGSADGSVPVNCSRTLVAALQNINAAPRYTEYENAGHCIWGNALGDPKVQQWLFAQRLGEKDSSSEAPSKSLGGRVLNQLLDYVTPQ